MLRRALFCAGLALATGAFAEEALPPVEVYGPTVCLACIDWTEHLRENGFTASYHGVADMAAVKRRLKVPVELESTLTAEVGGYFIEGHVPADDIKQLLQEKPRARGLAVPGLPRGAPGFDKSSPFCERGCTILDSESASEPVVRRELYNTLLVEKDGKTRVWARH
ncbi:MAG: metal-binding protein [Rhodocyclales bacterium]|nr:metal-binding protein [Rhodocyclales bacterium]